MNRDPQGGSDSIPIWVPPLVYAVLTLALFREFVFSDLMLLGQDTLSLGYAARAFFADALRTTGFPLWNPTILGGTPFLDSLAGGDALYPPSLLLLFLTDTYRALGWKLVLHVFLAGCFAYAWVRGLGVSRGAALVAGTIYLLAPYMVTLVYPGHDGKLFVTALTPLLFLAVEATMSRRDLLPAAGIAGVVGLVILTTHFQMAYFLFGAVGLYAAFRCIQIGREGEGWSVGSRRFGVFLAFSVLGAGVSAAQLLPAVSYVTEHSRRTMTTDTDSATGVAYSSSWSLHPEEAVSLVVPEFVGANVGGAEWTSNTYWGRNAFKLNHEYLGVVALLLALLAFTGGAHRGSRWFMAGLGAVALFFALGAHTPVWRLFYELLPGVSLFRAPSMAIFLTGFAVTTLAALGIDRGLQLVSEGRSAVPLRRLGAGVGVLGVAWLLAQTGVLETLWFALLDPGLGDAENRALAALRPHMRAGFFTVLILGAATWGVWWALARGAIGAAVGCGFLMLLVTADEMRIDAPFIQTLSFSTWAAPDANDRFLDDRSGVEDPFRVLSMDRGGQDVDPAMYGLDLAAGHHPNDLARYRELIGMEGSGIPENLLFHPNVLAILNVRYIVWPESAYGPFPIEELEPISEAQAPNGAVNTLHRYPGLPRARIVGSALVVPEDATVETILDLDAYDPAVTTVLNQRAPIELGGSEVRGEVTWVERTPDRVVLDVEATGPGLLVLADNWYPAWTAYVDGEPTAVLRADHALRAVPVEAGPQRVEFRYESDLLRSSITVSLVSLLILLGVVVGELYKLRAARSRSTGSEP